MHAHEQTRHDLRWYMRYHECVNMRCSPVEIVNTVSWLMYEDIRDHITMNTSQPKSMYIYIYIYRERERFREREKDIASYIYVSIHNPP